MLSNQLVSQNPQTPIFTAAVGDKARFRLMHPFGTGTSQVFTLSGHVWQRNPYKNDSRALGDNSLSQWIGSRDNHGSTDHFDLMVDKAGGEGVDEPATHLYSAFQPLQTGQGAWGLFRVGQSNAPPQTNAACAPIPSLTTAPARVVAPRTQKNDGLGQWFIRQPSQQAIVQDPSRIYFSW